MADMGALEKLLILAFREPDYSDSPCGTFESFLNPNEITLSYEMEYDSAQGAGTTNSRMNFKKAKPGDMSLTFFIDGTGANGKKIDVQQKIEEFQIVTGYDGTIHRPHYLKVVWGKLQVKRCVLKSASIAYKMFQPSGIPLRAIITATFTDNSDDRTRQAMARDESPDLTHVRVVRVADNLPLMCNEIYGDPGYYLQVAVVNGLDNFRKLVPGTKVFFPPLEK
ncbi:CIS tube protein [Geotalea toluenoxydans]